MTAVIHVSSNAFSDGEPIPERFAFCTPCAQQGSKMSTNISPQMSWSEGPSDTQSFAFLCVDVDVPTIFADANQEGKALSANMPRQDFYHSLLIDIPSTLHSLAEGAESKGLIKGGKPPGRVSHGVRGLNDFTMFMASNPDMVGDYGGYDGPCPPWNDELLHHYEFRIYALDVKSLGLAESGQFRGPDVMEAIEGHIVGMGKITGTYTQNPKVTG
ncbi:MAG: hypothetical protein CBB68_13160 [Rhodospirillaceae bacterium TMED8]|nr:YbhB/YbcL family Raf kinase inhibitor-like protein [Magnetovibrio sp.]OUT49052.1 MAG: hypothetical protein CBB68_13160 [Rhodospirillaceae bacterium TMED8]|tara:strand:- start:97 stop:741 length:645 start_codon:yes stop_codon:yes gene_type:complete